MINLAGRRD